MTSVELVVVSPLNRTLETALHCFAHLVTPATSKDKDSMETKRGKVPFVAVESLREQTGKHPCDRRVSIKLKQKEFPQIDFQEIAHDEDPYYSKHGKSREPQDSVIERIGEFMKWLEARPEKEIAVVSHGSYLLYLFQHILELEQSKLHRAHPPYTSSLEKNALNEVEKTVDDVRSVEDLYFKNCEMRTVIISFPHIVEEEEGNESKED
jgi:broad specificity phosphatase PhoE